MRILRSVLLVGVSALVALPPSYASDGSSVFFRVDPYLMDAGSPDPTDPEDTDDPTDDQESRLRLTGSRDVAYGQSWDLLLEVVEGEGSVDILGDLPPRVSVTRQDRSLRLSGLAPDGRHGPYVARLLSGAGAVVEEVVFHVDVAEPARPLAIAAPAGSALSVASGDAWKVGMDVTGGLAPYSILSTRNLPEGVVDDLEAGRVLLRGFSAGGNWSGATVRIQDATGSETETPSFSIAVASGSSAASDHLPYEVTSDGPSQVSEGQSVGYLFDGNPETYVALSGRQSVTLKYREPVVVDRIQTLARVPAGSDNFYVVAEALSDGEWIEVTRWVVGPSAPSNGVVVDLKRSISVRELRFRSTGLPVQFQEIRPGMASPVSVPTVADATRSVASDAGRARRGVSSGNVVLSVSDLVAGNWGQVPSLTVVDDGGLSFSRSSGSQLVLAEPLLEDSRVVVRTTESRLGNPLLTLDLTPNVAAALASGVLPVGATFTSSAPARIQPDQTNVGVLFDGQGASGVPIGKGHSATISYDRPVRFDRIMLGASSQHNEWVHFDAHVNGEWVEIGGTVVSPNGTISVVELDRFVTTRQVRARGVDTAYLTEFRPGEASAIIVPSMASASRSHPSEAGVVSLEVQDDRTVVSLSDLIEGNHGQVSRLSVVDAGGLSFSSSEGSVLRLESPLAEDTRIVVRTTDSNLGRPFLTVNLRPAALPTAASQTLPVRAEFANGSNSTSRSKLSILFDGSDATFADITGTSFATLFYDRPVELSTVTVWAVNNNNAWTYIDAWVDGGWKQIGQHLAGARTASTSVSVTKTVTRQIRMRSAPNTRSILYEFRPGGHPARSGL